MALQCHDGYNAVKDSSGLLMNEFLGEDINIQTTCTYMHMYTPLSILVCSSRMSAAACAFRHPPNLDMASFVGVLRA